MTIRMKIAARHLALAICLSPAAPAVAETFTYNSQFGNHNSNSSQNLNFPQAVALNGSGDAFVADYSNNRVVEYTTSGAYVNAFTGVGQLGSPSALAVNSSGDIYVAVTSPASGVVELNSSGGVVTSFGSSQFGSSGYATGLTLDSSGNVYVSDGLHNKVYEYSGTGMLLMTISTHLNNPSGVAVDSSGDIYITNSNARNVVEFNSSGTYITSFGTTGTTSTGKLSDPLGVAVDSSGNVYVSDSFISVERIVEYTSAGTYLTSFGSNGTGNGQLSGPNGLAVSSSGLVYVADSYNNRVEVFAPPVAVPEPSSLLMLGMSGVATAAWAARARRRGCRRS